MKSYPRFSCMEPEQLNALFFYGTIEQNWLGHQMAEIFKDRVYQPFLPLEKKGTLCLDIGGNIGLTSIYFSRYFERVITLEPSSQHFPALQKNMMSNTITNVTPLKKAIYIKNGKFPFGGPKDNKTMRSLHMATWQNGKSDEEVETVTFEKLFEDEKITHVDLLKIDIEGSETEVFSSPSFSKVANKIECIVGETHQWTGRHPNQLRDALKNNGFTLSIIPNDAALFVARRA